MQHQDFFDSLGVCPAKAECSVGVSPTWVEARSPVAWMAGSREAEGLKPIDKAIFGIVSE